MYIEIKFETFVSPIILGVVKLLKNTIAEKTIYQLDIEKSSSLKNFSLGSGSLKVEKITQTFEVKRILHPLTQQPLRIVSKRQLDEVVETLSFELREVSPEELSKFRKDGVPSFVLKRDRILYHATILPNLNLTGSNFMGAHKCAAAGNECSRLSAASDEDGGCAKVRNRSRYIERYPWIISGYETFNVNTEAFVVVQCLHYKECPPRKRIPPGDSIPLKLGLAQFVWDDVEDLREVKRRTRINLEHNGPIY